MVTPIALAATRWADSWIIPVNTKRARRNRTDLVMNTIVVYFLVAILGSSELVIGGILSQADAI